MDVTKDEFYTKEQYNALDAKNEAQKIAFAPYTFQTAITMRNLGLLQVLFDAGDDGITMDDAAKASGVDFYGVKVLFEYALSAEIVKLVPEMKPWKFVLSKIGFFLLHDKLTTVNVDFMQDICYQGAANMEESIKNGKPEGLKHFGEWPTVYDGLSQLSDQQKKSWFAFDHYYSDNAFPEALPIVFKKPVKNLMDIGGNTAKWTLECLNYNKDVKVSIVDLPGQIAVAEKNVADAGFADRVSTHPGSVLKAETVLPGGCDVVWMSQFLDCFSLDEVESILRKVYPQVDQDCDIYVLEPLWDQQKYRAATYALHATSLYFTTIANGNSKMYAFDEIKGAIEKAGFELVEALHEFGANDYSLMRFRKKG